MVEEARLEETPGGLAPASDGWFTVNVRDAMWITHEKFGAGCRFESPKANFPELGINIRVLQPGQPCAMYHRESNQEDFLVLSGECVLLVEEQERHLGPWDFVHFPPNTTHVVVGAGDGPCVVLMAGARDPEEELMYPASELAQRHGAGVERDTPSEVEAYAGQPARELGRPDRWEELPWS
ncbi:MAG TPA: cupin domain-containing protein [Thermoleophilaceae bacterium]|jgi:uncharacterized cupin superfamily protein